MPSLDVMYLSGYAIMHRKREDCERVLREMGFGPNRTNYHLLLVDVGEEKGIDFQEGFTFSETSSLYAFATSPAGKKLAYNHVILGERPATLFSRYDALRSGTDSHPEAVPFTDFQPFVPKFAFDGVLTESDNSLDKGSLYTPPGAQLSLPSLGPDMPPIPLAVGGEEEHNSPPRTVHDQGASNIDPQINDSQDEDRLVVDRTDVEMGFDIERRFEDGGDFTGNEEAKQLAYHPPPPYWLEAQTPLYIDDYLGPVYPEEVHIRVTVLRQKNDSLHLLAKKIGGDVVDDADDLSPRMTTIRIPPGQVLDPTQSNPTTLFVPLVTVGACSLIAVKRLFRYFPHEPLPGFDGCDVYIQRKDQPKALVNTIAPYAAASSDGSQTAFKWCFGWDQDVPEGLDYAEAWRGQFLCDMKILFSGTTNPVMDRTISSFGMENGHVSIPSWATKYRLSDEDRLAKVGAPILGKRQEEKRSETGKTETSSARVTLATVTTLTTPPGPPAHHPYPCRPSKEDPAHDMQDLVIIELPPEKLLKAVALGFLIDSPRMKWMTSYSYRLFMGCKKCTLAEAITAAIYMAGDKASYFSGLLRRIQTWPYLKVMVKRTSWIVGRVLNPYFGKAPPTISRSIINTSVAICREIALSEYQRTDTTYDTKKGKGKKESAEDSDAEDEIDGDSGDDETGSRRLQEWSSSKSGKRDLRSLLQHFMSFGDKVLKGNYDEWIDECIWTIVEREDWKHRKAELDVIHQEYFGKSISYLDCSTHAAGKVRKKKVGKKVDPFLYAVGVKKWRQLFKVLDPDPQPADLRRIKKHKGDIVWELEPGAVGGFAGRQIVMDVDGIAVDVDE